MYEAQKDCSSAVEPPSGDAVLRPYEEKISRLPQSPMLAVHGQGRTE